MPASTPKTDRAALSRTGNEPPLTLTENSRAALKSGSVSLRWLTGAFVTGLSGAALIGGALLTSVDGAVRLAQPMDTWTVVRSPDIALGLGDRNSSTAKGDKIDVDQEAEISRKVIQTTNVRHVGEKEFISIRPYELVSIPLSPNVTDVSGSLPPFNPLKIFADGGVFSAPEAAAEKSTESDSDSVAVEIIAFADAENISLDGKAELAESEIVAAVRAAVPFEENTDFVLQGPMLPRAMTAGAAIAPLSEAFDRTSFNFDRGGFAESTLPRNETVIAKTPADPMLEEATSTQVVTISRGDTLSSLMTTAGIDSETVKLVAETITQVFSPADLQPGQQIHMAMKADVDVDNSPAELIRMSLFENGAHLASVRRAADDGGFVALDASADIVRPVITAAAAPASGKRASIYSGLYESGMRNDIPETVLNRIVQIHSYDVDFQKKVQPGDSFTAFFELPDETGAPPDPLPLYISMTVRGEGRGFYKFRTPDDGVIDYYDDEGRSAKKFLIRKPMNGGVFRSGFGERRHPILRYRRMHTGVDWAAPRGTPIVAAGNGTVIESKWKSGYGKWVKIRHANGYESNYAHMSDWAKGIKEGIRVRQGQVIGYVGSTGLSTGPHLHYEVEVNGRHVDPLRIRLPRGRVLQAEMLAAFEKEKARLDDLMARPPVRSTVAERGRGAGETEGGQRVAQR